MSGIKSPLGGFRGLDPELNIEILMIGQKNNKICNQKSPFSPEDLEARTNMQKLSWVIRFIDLANNNIITSLQSS